jgi:MFS family permease
VHLVLPVLELSSIESVRASRLCLAVSSPQVAYFCFRFLLGLLSFGPDGVFYPPVFNALIAAVLQLVAFVLLEITKKPVLGIWAFAVIYGLSNGLMTIARVAVPLSLPGSKRYGAASAKLNVAFSIATAIAPVCFASFLRHTVPSILLIVCTSLALLGVATAAVLCSLWHAEVRRESRI